MSLQLTWDPAAIAAGFGIGAAFAWFSFRMTQRMVDTMVASGRGEPEPDRRKAFLGTLLKVPLLALAGLAAYRLGASAIVALAAGIVLVYSALAWKVAVRRPGR